MKISAYVHIWYVHSYVRARIQSHIHAYKLDYVYVKVQFLLNMQTHDHSAFLLSCFTCVCMQLIVGSEDFDIRIFKGDELLHEISEAEVWAYLCSMHTYVATQRQDLAQPHIILLQITSACQVN